MRFARSLDPGRGEPVVGVQRFGQWTACKYLGVLTYVAEPPGAGKWLASFCRESGWPVFGGKVVGQFLARMSRIFTCGCVVAGPPGVGKSSAARIIAAEFGYDVIELNASDVRNKKVRRLGPGAWRFG